MVMDIVDEYYYNNKLSLSSEQCIQILQKIKAGKNKEIETLKQKIKKFEEQRRAHEVWYQSLPPLRKLFAGRPPSHHQAVEYFVNVKERFQHIEQIKGQMIEVDHFIQLLQNEPERSELTLPNNIIEEIKRIRIMEVSDK